MQKENNSEIEPEVVFLSENIKNKNEEEKNTKTRILESKLKLLLIPESTSARPLSWIYSYLLLLLAALEVNMKVYSPSNMTEKW